MKHIMANVWDKMSNQAQIGLYTLMLATGLSLGANAQNTDTAETSLTKAHFKQNITSVVGDQKEQHVKWSEVCNTDNIEDMNFKEDVEQALSNIEDSKTGQVLFGKIKDNFSHRRLFDKEVDNDKKKIFMMDHSTRGTGDFNTKYNMSTADNGKSIYDAYVTLNPEEMRNIGYFHNGELFPFSLEQVIVHELGHSAYETGQVIKREYNRDNFQERCTNLAGMRRDIIANDVDGNALFGFIHERGELVEDIRQGRAPDAILRQQNIADINHYTDSINSVVSQNNNPLIQDFISNLNDVEAIVGAKERHAMEYENSYLNEMGLPVRTDYGNGMDLIMPTQSDSVLHVDEMTPSTTTGQAPLIGMGVL